MPNVPAMTMTVGSNPVVGAISLFYNDANMRMSNAEWELFSASHACRILIFDTRQSETVPVYDRAEAGITSGAESIPGNHTMILEQDPDFGELILLPEYLRVIFLINTI